MTTKGTVPSAVDKPSRAATRDMEPRIQQLFDDAAIQGERALSWVRAVFCGVAVLRELWFNSAHVLAGKTRDTMALAFLSLAVLGSVVLLLLPAGKGAPRIRRRLYMAVLLDTVVLLGATIGIVLYPTPQHIGMFYSPFITVFPFVITTSGLRLSRGVVLTSFLSTAAVLTLLAILDLRNGEQVQYPVGHVIFIALLMMMAGVVAYLMATRSRALVKTAASIVLEVSRVRERLGAYLSREVAEHALAMETFSMGGQRMEVAVLFSDLRGFTAWSEHLPPEQLVTELNAYLENMVLAIHSQGGVVDKYVGDSIMAVFGAPRSRGDDAASAIRAALAMQHALVRHNAERAAKGLPPMAQGIGVHFGAVVAGNVGTSQHAQYTVIGDAVNVASRLQSSTKDHKVAVLFSNEVRVAALAHPGAAPIPELTAVGDITVRGREAPVTTWTLKVQG